MNLPVIGCGAVSGVGRGAVGMGATIASWSGPPATRVAGDAMGERVTPRQQRLMSRAALLAAVALDDCTRGAPRVGSDTGAFFGAGPSSGDFAELRPVIAAAFDHHGRFSIARLGGPGLAACNPLLTFQLLPNFTLCHGAIARGLGGPNAAFFSRGSGTVAALLEAAAALTSGACPLAVAGGADSAIHPVTHAELRREGFVAEGLEPGEGASALLLAALSTIREAPLAWLRHVSVVPDLRAAPDVALAGALDGPPADEIVLAAWGPPARGSILGALGGRGRVLDLTAAVGETGAAAPALAWAVAIDRISAGDAARVLVLSAGTDGDLGVALFAGEAS